MRRLGQSGVLVPALGVGTNRWGSRSRPAVELQGVFSASIDAGAGLLDTAEIYQLGGSERAIGLCARRDARPVQVVAKFAPYPHRVSARSFHRALEGALDRLGLEAVDLYLVHFPYSPRGIRWLMDRLAEAAHDGRARAVGVSNFSARQMRLAADRLDRHGVALAANEVQYSLFHRDPERNGVLEACRDLDVALIAYRPLAGGRARAEGSPLDRAVAGVARERGKTPAQIGLSWLLSRDPRVVAIPGATRVEHLRENLGAVGLTLSEDELAALDRAQG